MTGSDIHEELDVTDLDKHMGVPMMPGELKEPVVVSDIRRWVQGMHYPNPLHYDEVFAEASQFGQIVAPQSFTVCCDTSHGCTPAQVGKIPESHLIFGGDEWWFFGPRIVGGDHLVCHRMPYDYKVSHTKFAGPTCFQRGDTIYINQRGERVAQQRSTSIRYKVVEAKDKKLFTGEGGDGEPEWTDDQLNELEEIKVGYIDQIQQLGHDKRLFDDVSVGDKLARNVLGPHSLASFTTEWRAYPMTTWGAMAKGPTTVRAEALGYTKEMSGYEGDRRVERVNPELTDAPTTARRGSSATSLGPPCRHGPRVRIRRLHGRLGTRPRRGLGGRVGLHHPFELVLPHAGLHRRRHVHRRRGGRQAGRAPPSPHRRGDRRDAQPGRRRPRQGRRRGGAARRMTDAPAPGVPLGAG